jgi:hypothetical protein
MAVEKEFLQERDQRITQMKLQGLSVPEIAKRFDLSPTAVHKALQRQYQKFAKLNEFGLTEAVMQELERLDLHYKAIFPLTQFRNVTMPDGTSVTVEPNEKFVAQALAISDRRVKLLGLDRVKGFQAPEDAPMRAALAGSEKNMEEVANGDPEMIGRQMLELMRQSGMLKDEVVTLALGESAEPLEEAESIEIEPKELTA